MHPSHSPTPPSIREYAIIGDCRTAALVSASGSIDWLCLPRFEGPSVFGAILDPEKGGCFRVGPSRGGRGSRRYLPRSNVLETTFEAEGGVLRVTDLFVVGEEDQRFAGLTPDHEILRRVECLAGEVEVDVLYDPRPGYGATVPAIRGQGELGWFFSEKQDVLALRGDLELHPRTGAPGLHGRVGLRAGEARWLSLSAERGLPPVLEPLGEAAERRLRETTRWWSAWTEACSYEGEHRDLVLRSALTLKLLAFPPSGAILAAPTTSLPERIGGERNWDYRYCWLRDAAMTLRVLLDIGFIDEGEAFLAWLLHATRASRKDPKVFYDVHGRGGQTERTLANLAGYRGSRPVRIGNAARDQFQLDVYGELIGAAYEFCRHGGELDGAEGRLLSDLAQVVCDRWREPDHGVWEPRTGLRHFTHSKTMCWVALNRMGQLSDEGRIDLKVPREVLEREKKNIVRFIEERGVDPESGSYTAFCGGGGELDATLLRIGIDGYEEAGSERMRHTLAAVRDRLGSNGLLYRYRYDDGLGAPEQGAFGICSFWEAELLARMGNLDEARERFDRVAGEANDVGLFSEEIDPNTGELLGNFPQAFTHVGLISAATVIARAEGRRPEQEAGAPSGTEARSEEEEKEDSTHGVPVQPERRRR